MTLPAIGLLAVPSCAQPANPNKVKGKISRVISGLSINNLHCLRNDELNLFKD
jgi:hypothetical protein